MKMFLTRHAQKRLQQRGRRPGDVDFVMEYGTLTEAGIILTNTDAAAVERQARRMIDLAGKLRNVLVACDGDMAKTVFRASRNQQSRML